MRNTFYLSALTCKKVVTSALVSSQGLKLYRNSCARKIKSVYSKSMNECLDKVYAPAAAPSHDGPI